MLVRYFNLSVFILIAKQRLVWLEREAKLEGSVYSWIQVIKQNVTAYRNKRWEPQFQQFSTHICLASCVAEKERKTVEMWRQELEWK